MVLKKGYKTIYLGSASVGKTSIIKRILNRGINEQYSPTIGAAFDQFTYKSKIFDMWDTAGQERYESYVKLYYRDAKIILYVFDVNNIYSIDKIIKYFRELEYEDNIINYNHNFIIVANKIDLISDADLKAVIKHLLYKLPGITINNIICTSAKDNIGIDELKEKLLELSNNIKDNQIEKEIPIILDTDSNNHIFSKLYLNFCSIL